MSMKFLSFLLCLFLIAPTLTNAAEAKNNFLVMSDIHLDSTSMHSMEISPSTATRINDLDKLTFEKLLFEINNNIKKGVIAQPKFIIILGDLVSHMGFSSGNLSKRIASQAIVFSTLKKNFPDTPIFYTYGNNDSLVSDYGPFKDTNNSKQYKSAYEIATLKSGWADGFLSTGTKCSNQNNFPCIITEDTTNGHYSGYLESKLRLIALNTVLFSATRTNVTERDALNELQWFEKELQEATKNQESVLITMHIPPGNNVRTRSHFWMAQDKIAFLKILKTYQHTIIGLLAGHTHQDELKIIKDPSKKIIAGLYSIAALSTSHANNPSVKTFNLSKINDQWELSNYETFHFYLDNHSNTVFNKLYFYNNYYCNNKDKDLLECLNHVTADKMIKYFSAGNINFAGKIKSPEDINLFTP